MMGEAPSTVWVIYPSDGSEPVLWTSPCPFPVGDEGEIVEYERRVPQPKKSPLSEAIDKARGGPAPARAKTSFA